MVRYAPRDDLGFRSVRLGPLPPGEGIADTIRSHGGIADTIRSHGGGIADTIRSHGGVSRIQSAPTGGIADTIRSHGGHRGYNPLPRGACVAFRSMAPVAGPSRGAAPRAWPRPEPPHCLRPLWSAAPSASVTAVVSVIDAQAPWLYARLQTQAASRCIIFDHIGFDAVA